MSDEKMRELMSRMAEMSPKPPDFPDGVLTAKPVRPQRSGAWVFAVAGLAVLVLALPFVFWGGGRGQVASPSDTTLPEASPTTAPEISSRWLAVFLVQDVDSSHQGNPTIVPVSPVVDWDQLDDQGRPLGDSEVRLLTNLDRLGLNLSDGFRSAVPSGVELLSESRELVEGEWIVILDMNEEFRNGAGGALADFTMLSQLIYTATQNHPPGRVLFTIEGETIEDFGMEGLSLVDPVGRDSFLDHLNLIIITEPVTVDTDGVLTVRGRANVFEANVLYRFDHEDSDVIGHVTATCGTGCWGEFEITMDISSGSYGDADLLVYTGSGEDGSPVNVVRIPRSAWIQE